MKSRIPFIYHRVGIFTVIALTWSSWTNAMDLIGMSASGVTTCEYDSKDVTLKVSQVHTARLFTDYEKHGFFRIGLLPIPVAEDVQIEIRSADCLTNALSGIHFWNEPSLAVRRLELRNLEIKSFDEKQPRLSARLARIGQDGTLELSNVSLNDGTGQPKIISKATLQLSGDSVGWLRWNCDGQLRNFYCFNQTKK